jgi:hypothetical protein
LCETDETEIRFRGSVENQSGVTMEKKLNYVIGPGGAKLTMENLPLPNTARWVPRKKAEIVAAVQGGLLSLSEACDRYALTLEEFTAWQDAIDLFGLQGLRLTHSRGYRQVRPILAMGKKYEESLTASGLAAPSIAAG